ncbi:zf-HC2 domain-containing protein [bacterium]|nr:zf-HC2 domain-containing protein [bacterium]
MPASPRRRRILSAYIDGELSPRWRSAVERSLERNATLRSEMEQFVRVKQLVGGLPLIPVPKAILSRSNPARPVSAPLEPDQIDALLIAYANRELEGSNRDLVKRTLLREPQHQATLRDHQRVAKLLDQIPRKRPPADLLAIAIDRLNAWASSTIEEPAEPAGSATLAGSNPTGSTWGEYLSAYLDGELSSRKTQKVQERLAASSAARDYLSDLSRIQTRLMKLPFTTCPEVVLRSTLERVHAEVGLTTPNHLERVSAGNVAIDWPADIQPTRPMPKRSFGWQSIAAVAASLVVVVGIGYILSGIPLRPADTGEALLAKAEPVKQSVVTTKVKEIARPVGHERIQQLVLATPYELRRDLDAKQVTVAARDVERFLDTVGPIGSTLKRIEPTPAGGRVIELTGEPAEIAELLARLADASSTAVGVEKIEVGTPTTQRADRWVVRSDKKASIDLMASLGRGLKAFQQQMESLAQTRRKETETSLVDAQTPSLPTGASRVPNEPVVLARPLRFSLVIVPAQPSQ